MYVPIALRWFNLKQLAQDLQFKIPLVLPQQVLKVML